MTPLSRIVVPLAIGALYASTAWAQEPPSFRARQVIVSAGVGIASSYPVGDLTATLRRNATGVPPPFTLLRAESEIGRATAVEGRVGYTLTRAIGVEVGGSYSTAQLGVTVSQDPELSGGAFASEDVDQFVVDGSVVVHLPVRVGERLRPYAIGGAGYLRQLPRGRLAVETGATIHLGGGAHYWLRGAAVQRGAIGIRGEMRYVRRTGGLEFERRARSFPTLSVLAFVGL